MDLKRIRQSLNLPESGDIPIHQLPFVCGDVTAGTENELQTVVTGDSNSVDLPLMIQNSIHYTNIKKRVKSGDMPKKVLEQFEQYLSTSDDDAWENSWIRFPLRFLSASSLKILNRDLRADKSDLNSVNRSDIGKFTFVKGEECWLRIPISYTFKLALSEAIKLPTLPKIIRESGNAYMKHYLNDNTSPETFSFYPSLLTSENGMGKAVSKEGLKRFAYTQVLLQYANHIFLLSAHGQNAVTYLASTPPIKQRQLNELISDNYYRELFMSPCLSGWEKGEEKHRYMHLCHQVLSRSQINAVKKLKDAGIITSNLVVLPNTSNISLANNGTHLSLGSKKLTAALSDPDSGYTAADEKCMGDLGIKIMEHFLPLFVGTYTAAPYRLDFADFHPEKVLGFLPHELDFTHLRMMWRRWRKKADLKIFNQPITPFGPEWIDKAISKLFNLKGDYIPDYRLIDYLVSLMSTDQNPALNGLLGNDHRLKKDLDGQGIFDESMSLYLMMKLRQKDQIGFSGYEGRYYSLFYSLKTDLSEAANLQTLLSALASKYILNGQISHEDIPDTPSSESERRQIFFGTAIGIPTFFVKKDTSNKLLQKIIKKSRNTRNSRRYNGYMRLYNLEYRKALIELLKEDAGDLIEMMGMKDTITDLENRINYPDKYSAAGKLTKDICSKLNIKKPMDVDASTFNEAAGCYYREELRLKHYKESLDSLKEDMVRLDKHGETDGPYKNALVKILPENSTATAFFQMMSESLLNDSTKQDDLEIIIQLITLSIRFDQDIYQESQSQSQSQSQSTNSKVTASKLSKNISNEKIY